MFLKDLRNLMIQTSRSNYREENTMKILFDTDKRKIKEGRPTRIDNAKSDAEKEIDMISMLAVATVANARKFYNSEKAQRMFAKFVYATAMRELGDDSLVEETKAEMASWEEKRNEVQM